jgi:hypothetical protein
VVVHYWFADGRPVGLEELVVEPSARWRTWSTRPAERPGAGVWEVIVVERDSGCVLQARTIQQESRKDPGSLDAGPGAFRAYSTAFQARLGGLEGIAVQPDPVLVETRQAFLSRAAIDLLGQAEIEVSVEFADSERPLTAVVHPFRVAGQVCEKRDCRSSRMCQAAVSRCVRRHDSRDCSVCSFRNPLNNRCVSEVEDPVCLAARAARNRQYENERQVCLVEEERARADCERLRAQEIRSCEIESRSAEHVCESNLESLKGMPPEDSLAAIEGSVTTSGSVVGRFVDFEMQPDFSSLKMAFEFTPGATYSGSWRMTPTGQGDELAACLSGWQGDFEGRLLMPAPRLTLIGSPRRHNDEWVTNWSGFMLPASVSPTPLESVFRERPDYLAACGIALTVERFEEAIQGTDAGFLLGRAELDIRPLPTRLFFGPDVLRFGETEHHAEVSLDSGHLQVRSGAPVPKR